MFSLHYNLLVRQQYKWPWFVDEKGRQGWYRNKIRKECSAEWLHDLGSPNSRKLSWRGKGVDELKSPVTCLWAKHGLQETQLLV